MNGAVTLLVSSAGRRVGLVECFRKDAAALGLKLRVVAVDAEPSLSAACTQADVSYQVPSCGAPEFIDCVKDIAAREGVSLVVPTIDPELPVYAAAAERLAALGVAVSVSCERTIQIARNKLLTAEVLMRAGVPVPRTALLSSVGDGLDWRYPLILKPSSGSASIGIRSVGSPVELAKFDGAAQEYLAQELWQGSEYTVNVFFDRSGRLRSVVPHRRIEVRAGEVSKGRTHRFAPLQEIAERIADALPGARGPLCFQAIVKPEGEIAVFEINARFGGGYPLAHAAGARFSQWLLEECIGSQCSASNEWRDGLTMLRYDAATFVE